MQAATKVQDGTRDGVQVNGWTIEANDSHILGARELLLLSTKLGNPYQSSYEIPFFVPGSLGSLKPCSCGSALVMGVRMHLPEGVFGHNWLQLRHEASGVSLRFDVTGALMRWVLLSVENGSGGLKVTAAREGGWVSKWPSMFQTQEYDWTYTTDYRGGATAPVPSEAATTAAAVPVPGQKQPAQAGGTQAAQGGLPCKADAFSTCGLMAAAAAPTLSPTPLITGSTQPASASAVSAAPQIQQQQQQQQQQGREGGAAAEAERAELEWEDGAPGGIDMELLTRQEEILYYKSLILYEDFLHDNGVAQLSLKIRVMPSCWFVLLRYWLRVDGVIIRLRDTRCFHAFGSRTVVREHTLKERPLPPPPMMPMAGTAGMPPPMMMTMPGGSGALPPPPEMMMMMGGGVGVIHTAEEAAELLRPRPPMEQTYEVLTLQAATSGVATADSDDTPAPETVIDLEPIPPSSSSPYATDGMEVSEVGYQMDECTECMAVTTAPIAVAIGSESIADVGIVAIGSSDGEILICTTGVGSGSGGRHAWLKDAHRAAEFPRYETGTLSLGFVHADGGRVFLASSGEDGTLKLWGLAPLLFSLPSGDSATSSSRQAATSAACECVATVPLDGEGADYTRGGERGARTACVQLLAAPPRGGSSQATTLAAAVGRSVLLVNLPPTLLSVSASAVGGNGGNGSNGCSSHSLGAVESSVTALELRCLPGDNGGDGDGCSLLAACYGAVTIWSAQSLTTAAKEAAAGGGQAGGGASLGLGATRRLGYKGPLLGLCVSPQGGHYVASGCQDGTMHVWSLGPEAQVAQPLGGGGKGPPTDFSCGGYAEKVSSHVWSACARYLASAGGEHAIIWEFESASVADASLTLTTTTTTIAGAAAASLEVESKGVGSPPVTDPSDPSSGGSGGVGGALSSSSAATVAPLNKKEAGAICTGQGARIVALAFSNASSGQQAGRTSALLASAGQDGTTVVYKIGGWSGALYQEGMPNLYLPFRRCGVPAPGGRFLPSSVARLGWGGAEELHVATEDGQLVRFHVH